MRTSYANLSRFTCGRLTWAWPEPWWQQDEHRSRLVALMAGRFVIFALLLLPCIGAPTDKVLLAAFGWLLATAIRMWRRGDDYQSVISAAPSRDIACLVVASDLLGLAVWFPLWLLIATYYPPSVWLLLAILSSGLQ